MQTTQSSNVPISRTQQQMEGVAKQDLSANTLQGLRSHAFDRAIGTTGHENRCFHLSVRRRQATTAGLSILSKQLK
jgi:hypothetical protein